MSDVELHRLRAELARVVRARDEAQRLARELDQQLRQLLETSTHDELTGYLNRRAGQDAFRAELNRALRERTATALLVLDLDAFKQVNDTFGHDVGDRVLARITRHVRTALRDSDIPIRWGGDEFCIVLPGTGQFRARVVAEKIVDTLRKTPFDRPIALDSSCGVAATDEPFAQELVADIDMESAHASGSAELNLADLVQTFVSRQQRFLFKAADLRCYWVKRSAAGGRVADAERFERHVGPEQREELIRAKNKIGGFFWRHDGSKWIPPQGRGD